MIARGIGTLLRQPLLRQPLLQFLLVGGAVFAVGRGWDASPGNGNIVIAQPAIDQMISTYQGQFGVKPTSQQLQALIDRHVDDEVLYREGVALGVDRDDEIVRRRVVQKMRFLTEDRTMVGEPDEAALRAFHQAHQER